MTFFAKVGHWNNKTNGTSDTIAGLSFTPKALILWAGNQSATGWQSVSSALNVMFGMGFSAANGAGPTMQYGATCHATLTDNNSHRYQYQYQAAYPLVLYDYNAALKLQISSIAFNSDGFVATYSTTPATAYTIYYLAIGGTDITGAGVTGWQSNTSTGNQSITLAGTAFQPTAVLHISDEFTTAPPIGQSNVIGSLIFGAMDSAGNQWSTNPAALYRSATSSLEDRTQVTNACIVNVNAANQTSATGGNTISDVASFVSMNAGGFTVNWTTKSNNGYYFYSLALAGPNIKAGNFAKTGQVGAVTDTITGIGFTPTAVLAATDSSPASAANVIHERFTLGASDGTNFGVLAKTGQSNIAYFSYTVDSNYNDATNSIIVANSTAGNTTDVAATITNFASGQFQAVWGADTTTDATQVLYIAFGAGITDVTMPGVTATVAPVANAPLIGVSPSAVAAVVVSPVSNVPLVNVGPPSVMGTVTPVLNVPLVNVAPPGVTGTVGPTAYAPIINVSVSPLTAVVSPTANVPLPNVVLVAMSPAVVSPVLNVPLIGVTPPEVTGLVSPSAYVPIIDVSTTPLTAIVGPLANVPLPDVWLVPADTAVVSPVANWDEIGVGPPGVTAIINVRANVPQLIWAYRHQRDVLIIRDDPRCLGLFVTPGKRCSGILASRGSRNVGLLEIDITKDT